MLELIGLRKTFGPIVALDGCSLSVRPGSVLGFLGRNGAGKTTAMRAIFGIVQPEQGEMRWKGAPIVQDTRLRFGYMPEERGLYPRMRVLDQLAYISRLRGLDNASATAEVRRWLARLELSDRESTLLDALSHGNQQKVQLAASLVGSPDLLVLDEPFSGLDPIAVTTMAEVIAERARNGSAVMFSSHQLDLVEDICDDIAIITRGHVILTGGLDEIRRRSTTRHVFAAFEHPVAQADVDGLSARLGAIAAERATGDSLRLRVPSRLDAAAVLSAMATLGTVRQFRFEPPSLLDIFQETIGE